MRPQEIIAKKRDGETLSQDEIKSFVEGVTNAAWADYQISALLMAMFIGGLSLEEQNFLTEAMLASGDKLDFSDIDAPLPVFTSKTSTSKPSANFFDIIEATIKGIDSTVAVASRSE